MVFVIGFLVFSARKGTSLALRNGPRQNRGKSRFWREKVLFQALIHQKNAVMNYRTGQMTTVE